MKVVNAIVLIFSMLSVNLSAMQPQDQQQANPQQVGQQQGPQQQQPAQDAQQLMGQAAGQPQALRSLGRVGRDLKDVKSDGKEEKKQEHKRSHGVMIDGADDEVEILDGQPSRKKQKTEKKDESGKEEKHQKKDVKEEQIKAEECCICFEPIANGEELTTTCVVVGEKPDTLFHRFHKVCLEEARRAMNIQVGIIWCISCNKSVKSLKDQCFDALKREDLSSQAILACVKRFIDAGLQLDARDVQGFSLLQQAGEYGQVAIVEMFFNSKKLLRVLVENKQSGEQLLKAVNDCLGHGAYVNAKNYWNATPLHLAAVNGHMQVVAKLLEMGADKDAKTKLGATPLHLAAAKGHVSVVIELLNAGADTEAVTEDGFIPLQLAVQYGQVSVVAELLNRIKDKKAKAKNELVLLQTAIEKGHVSVVVELLKRTENKEIKAKKDLILLHMAARNGNASMVVELLKTREDKEARSEDGLTLLHMAAQNGHLSVAVELLKVGADKEAKANNGFTPLMFACRALEPKKDYCQWDDSHIKIIKLLVSKGAVVPEQYKPWFVEGGYLHEVLSDDDKKQ